MTLAPASGATATTMLVALELAACVAVPFFFSGVVISLALTRSPFPIGRVYAVDLAGAAAGRLGVLAVLNFTDGPSAVLWVGAITALAAVSFSASEIGGEPASAMPLAGRLMRAKVICAVLVVCAAANGITGKGLQPLFVKGKLEPR